MVAKEQILEVTWDVYTLKQERVTEPLSRPNTKKHKIFNELTTIKMKSVRTYVEARNRFVAEYNKLQEYENTVIRKEVESERENTDQTENKNN